MYQAFISTNAHHHFSNDSQAGAARYHTNMAEWFQPSLVNLFRLESRAAGTHLERFEKVEPRCRRVNLLFSECIMIYESTSTCTCESRRRTKRRPPTGDKHADTLQNACLPDICLLLTPLLLLLLPQRLFVSKSWLMIPICPAQSLLSS